MTPNEPKVGDRVIHHGHFHDITSLTQNASVGDDGESIKKTTMVEFENGTPHEYEMTEDPETGEDVRKADPETGEAILTKRGTGFIVKADASELRWSEGDRAWYLTGRVLGNDERTILQAMTGSWPPPETHLSSRRLLDSLDSIHDEFKTPEAREKLKAVIAARRLKPVKNESAKAFAARVDAYATACIEHVESHRAERAASRKGA